MRHLRTTALRLLATLAGALLSTATPAARHAIPMRHNGAATYYVGGSIAGYGPVQFLVDTGAGFMTINAHTLSVLKRSGNATFVRKLTGVMADGTLRVVPVYRLRAITLGERCVLHNVEAAVFPHRTRPLLGLSALERTAPFVFSTRPPRLVVSHCTDS